MIITQNAIKQMGFKNKENSPFPNKDHDYFVGIQIKHNFDVVFTKYDDILEGWKKYKAELTALNVNLHFILLIINRGADSKNQKIINSFVKKNVKDKEDEDVFIVFSDLYDNEVFKS